MEQRDMERRLLRTAFLLLLLSGLLVALSLARVESLGLRIALWVFAALPLLFSLGLFRMVWLANVTRREGRNFFLYDPRLRGNRDPSELELDEVMDRTFRYMSTFRQGRQFYLARLFDEEGGAPEVFKPLFCYQLFQLLILCDAQERWDAFLSCGKELADTFDAYLAKEEEDELCRRLQVAVACYPEEGSAAFRAYLLPLREHFNEKIMSYVQRHLHEFE